MLHRPIDTTPLIGNWLLRPAMLSYGSLVDSNKEAALALTPRLLPRGVSQIALLISPGGTECELRFMPGVSTANNGTKKG